MNYPSCKTAHKGFSGVYSVLVSFLLVALSAGKVWAWGSYGHQQINSEAINQLRSTKVGACLAKHRDLLVRLSITPDLDWKMSSQDHFAFTVYEIESKLPTDKSNTYLLAKLKTLAAVVV
jgi:hypothetical protein